MTSKLALLRDELTNDPLGRGYSGMTDQQAADSMNARDRSRTRSIVPSWEVLAAIRPAHYQAIEDAAQLRYLTLLFSVSDIPLGDANIRTALASIFTGATATLAGLQALQDESLSRAQELGIGVAHSGDIGKARTL